MTISSGQVECRPDAIRIRALRLIDVTKAVGVSRATVWRWVQSDPTFPKPFKLNGSVTVWDEAEVHGWLQAKMAERGGANV